MLGFKSIFISEKAPGIQYLKNRMTQEIEGFICFVRSIARTGSISDKISQICEVKFVSSPHTFSTSCEWFLFRVYPRTCLL